MKTSSARVRVFRGTGGHTVPAVKPLPQHGEPDPERMTTKQMIYFKFQSVKSVGKPGI